jgi:hypothetical protein
MAHSRRRGEFFETYGERLATDARLQSGTAVRRAAVIASASIHAVDEVGPGAVLEFRTFAMKECIWSYGCCASWNTDGGKWAPCKGPVANQPDVRPDAHRGERGGREERVVPDHRDAGWNTCGGERGALRKREGADRCDTVRDVGVSQRGAPLKRRLADRLDVGPHVDRTERCAPNKRTGVDRGHAGREADFDQRGATRKHQATDRLNTRGQPHSHE